MDELIDIGPDYNVLETEYQRLLGFPENYEVAGRSRELMAWTRQWYAENGTPWVYARQTDELDLSNGQLTIKGVPLSAKRLRKLLVDAQAHAVVLIAVSAGEQCEAKARKLWLEEKPDEYFFMEVYGSAVVEHLITTTGARFCGWAEQRGLAVLPHASPGYSGWEMLDQKYLLEVIRSGGRRAIPGEVQALDSGMLKPKKSQLAVFGITRQTDRVQKLTELIPCDSCSMRSCQYRRAPHQRSRIQIEEVQRLQAGARNNAMGNVRPGRHLNSHARYSTSTRALRKWSQERLDVRYLEDQSVEARFRYEGTTCSNLGHRLEYDYYVKLSPAHDGHKILEMTCSPAPGDSGYTYMCKYISDAALLTHAIEQEKPLFGKPLVNVLFWQRQYSPAGCYCDSVSREHKWGLVFEVIHYALAQQENLATNDATKDDRVLEYHL